MPYDRLKIPSRFYSLDFLRGIAALAVVFWHWDHFFFDGLVLYRSKAIHQPPMYDIFFLFYEKGRLGVDFFFTLSGFIFFWLYADSIRNKTIKGVHFALLRFSRLYPLHLATLILVFLGQLMMHELTGSYFIIRYHDLYHFFLQILFVSHWGFQKHHSFNGPIWSVSIEIFLYCLFYLVCRLKLIRLRMLWAYVIFGLLIGSIYPYLGRGIFQFFLGGLTYHAFIKLLETKKNRLALIWLIRFSLVILVIALFDARFNLFKPASLNFIYDQLHFTNPFYSNLLADHISSFIYTALLFPAIILIGVLLECEKGPILKKFSMLGDISYAAYLLHFPLQLYVKLLFVKYEWDINFFNTNLSLICFMLLLIILSKVCYARFEMPAQDYLRKRFIR